jgi:hypothetical protein
VTVRESTKLLAAAIEEHIRADHESASTRLRYNSPGGYCGRTPSQALTTQHLV